MTTVPFEPTEHPHRRRNALTGEWVLVSPHRTKRPWQGQVEKSTPETRLAYDPACYLCPGNERVGGKRNPQYTSTFVFDNDFSALLPDGPSGLVDDRELFQTEAETGICRVICFSPRHDLTLPEMELGDIRRVVDVWAQQVEELGSRPDVSYVQIFENNGAVMGCIQPAPARPDLGQPYRPRGAGQGRCHQRAYLERHGQPLLFDYLARGTGRPANASSCRTGTGSRWCPTGRCGPSRRCCCRGVTCSPCRS